MLDKNNYLTFYDDKDEPIFAVRLTEKGKTAYENKEAICFEKGHFDIMLDLRGIKALGYELGL